MLVAGKETLIQSLFAVQCTLIPYLARVPFGIEYIRKDSKSRDFLLVNRQKSAPHYQPALTYLAPITPKSDFYPNCQTAKFKLTP